VALVTLNRPKQLNALNAQLIGELDRALTEFGRRPGGGAVVLTGSEKAFAAGADIKEMATKDFAEASASDFIAPWARIAEHRKPGDRGGGRLRAGRRLRAGDDVRHHPGADTARFGQPEINLGHIPGAAARSG
jgi:enoyl-CoA hydratase